jgi:hypothetical protein
MENQIADASSPLLADVALAFQNIVEVSATSLIVLSFPTAIICPPLMASAWALETQYSIVRILLFKKNEFRGKSFLLHNK